MILGNLKTIDGRTISIEINENIISKVYYDKKLGKDLEGRLVIPGFVDSHAHIDSNFLLDVCEPVESTKFIEVLERLVECKENLSVDQIYSLSKKSIEYYLLNGSLFVRTHIRINGKKGLERLKIANKLKKEYNNLIHLQIIGFFESENYFDEDSKELIYKAIEVSVDGLGAEPHLQPSLEDRKRLIKFLFDAAIENKLKLDFHADYSDDPNSRVSEIIVSEALKRGIKGVSLSHLVSLHSYNQDYAERLMKWMKNADVNVIVAPITELEESGSFENYPKKRGLPRVNELLEHGINVAIGHNDIQNHFNPLGIGDMLHAIFTLAISDYMFFPTQIEKLFYMATYNGAKALQLEKYGMAENMPANLVILDAKSPIDAVRKSSPARLVISNGKLVHSGGISL
ncbi:amidohydrolase family protein [Acidianus infernus]|uniref:Amidohydrolase family protein n=1 Tax=Acidianus infernus TaxID=12915 RepID=A0A6A9QCH9_ACIIN|nr:amidohydrolase family protein [Acidianus infernus]MUM64901.1 amidohydrolase family protein [Acidianus infernus]